MKRSRLFLITIIMLTCATVCNAAPKDITLGFDGLADLSTNLNAFGVSFTGATVLACGGTLNCGYFPPFSGRNVIYDTSGGNGVITAVFDASATGPVRKVSVRITGNRNITMTAFDKDNAVLDIAETGGANYVGVGTPNKLVTVESETVPIASVNFHDSGNSYTIDDFTFRSDRYVVVLDPGHGQLLDKDGVTLHYQRPASPTFGLREDNLTLLIANAAKSQLEVDNKYTVYLTRTGSRAPITERGITGCGAPKYDYCNDDLKLRVEKSRQYDLASDVGAVFVSVHTNGSDIPIVGRLKNGTLSQYCSGRDDYSPLAQGMLDGIVALGIKDLGIGSNCNTGVLKRMGESNIPNSLVEVAYHSNTFKISGPTDEERLNDSTFRTNAGKSIGTAIDQYIVNELDGGGN